MTSPVLHGVAALSHLGVIRVAGPEAASFLHNQLTQDIALLGASEARLAALCSPKGRMLASFVAVRPEPEQVWLVCSRDLLAATPRLFERRDDCPGAGQHHVFLRGLPGVQML